MLNVCSAISASASGPAPRRSLALPEQPTPAPPPKTLGCTIGRVEDVAKAPEPLSLSALLMSVTTDSVESPNIVGTRLPPMPAPPHFRSSSGSSYAQGLQLADGVATPSGQVTVARASHE